MIDENKLIEDLESLPFIHGRYDHEHANIDFISGIETWHETVIAKINEQPKVYHKNFFLTTNELAKEVAEKAMDEYEYKGKTIRQWVDEILKYDWTPCSELLPEDTDEELYPMCIVTLDNGDVCLGVYRHDDKVWYTRMSEGEEHYSTKHKVLAWMPRPEPYHPNVEHDKENPEWKDRMMQRFMKVD